MLTASVYILMYVIVLFSVLANVAPLRVVIGFPTMFSALWTCLVDQLSQKNEYCSSTRSRSASASLAVVRIY